MERVVPFLADVNGPYKQLLAAEQTAQSLQAWIQEKNDAIHTIKQQILNQDLPDNAMDGHIKLLEEDISRFKQLQESNEASRNHWREMHMTAWRATVRPLKVVDMPNEILQMIFGNFKDDRDPQIQLDPIDSDSTLPSPDVTSIKNIRLTCRNFCDNGSKFLLPVVNFSFTRSSLQRLEDISNHSTISAGVRILRVHANPYNALLANDRYLFRRATHTKLWLLKGRIADDMRQAQKEVANACSLARESELFRTSELRAALTEADRVMEAMREVDGATKREDRPDNFEKNVKNALDQAHEEYVRRYREQQSLMQDRQVHDNIATAVRKMWSIQGLHITNLGGPEWDHIIRSGLGGRYDGQKYKALLGRPNPFWDLVIHVDVEDSLLDWDPAPQFSLLNKLPLVIEAASNNLTRLNIVIPPTLSLEVLAADLPNVRHACQNLKVVQVRVCQGLVMQDSRPRFVHASLPTTYSLLDALLVSPRLEVVRLFLERAVGLEWFDSTESIGSVLANLSWDTLRSVCLFGFPVKVDELQQVFEGVAGKLHLDLNGIYLMEGTWAQALEILRGRADSASRVTSPRGVELRGMVRWETRNFRRKFQRQGLGPASLYIRGVDIPNPLVEEQ
ncbi:hypothetical protein LA080_016129 [Diaporthe eres]|nr:hypothetical protein LA080_016129 [Diaporthe eres]